VSQVKRKENWNEEKKRGLGARGEMLQLEKCESSEASLEKAKGSLSSVSRGDPKCIRQLTKGCSKRF
jgi:hypothetical protein